MTVQRRIFDYLSEPYHLKHGATIKQISESVYADDPNGGPDNIEGVLRVLIWKLRRKGHNITRRNGRYVLIPASIEERVKLELARQGVTQYVDIGRLVAAIA